MAGLNGDEAVVVAESSVAAHPSVSSIEHSPRVISSSSSVDSSPEESTVSYSESVAGEKN